MPARKQTYKLKKKTKSKPKPKKISSKPKSKPKEKNISSKTKSKTKAKKVSSKSKSKKVSSKSKLKPKTKKVSYKQKPNEKKITEPFKKIINENESINSITKHFMSLIIRRDTYGKFGFNCPEIDHNYFKVVKVISTKKSDFGTNINVALLANCDQGQFIIKQFTISVYEYEIGQCINSLMDDHFMKTYFIYKNYYPTGQIKEKKESEELNHFDSHMVIEYIENSNNLYDVFFESRHDFYSNIFQILISLCNAYNKLKFVHVDLHGGNVLVQKIKDKKTNYKMNGKNYSVDEKYFMKIIDFGKSVVNKSCIENNNILNLKLDYEHSTENSGSWKLDSLYNILKKDFKIKLSEIELVSTNEIIEKYSNIYDFTSLLTWSALSLSKKNPKLSNEIKNDILNHFKNMNNMEEIIDFIYKAIQNSK